MFYVKLQVNLLETSNRIGPFEKRGVAAQALIKAIGTIVYRNAVPVSSITGGTIEETED